MSVNKYNSTTGQLERLDGIVVDSAPTQGSSNAVSSGGVYTALQEKMPLTTIDSAPTANSNNLVRSGGVYTALDGKQNKAWTSIKTGTSGSYDSVNISDLKNTYSEILVCVCVRSDFNNYRMPFVIPVNELNTGEMIFYGERDPQNTAYARFSGASAEHPNTVQVGVIDSNGAVTTDYTIYAR